MRRWAAGGVVIATLMMADAFNVVGQPPPNRVRPVFGPSSPVPLASNSASATKSSSLPWYKKMFASEPEPTAKAEGTNSTPKMTPKESAAQTLDQEVQANLHRMKLCTRLKEVAAETGDDQLMLQAIDLERQSIELYNRKVAHLPGVRVTRNMAEKKIDEKLGTGIATDPLESAAKKAPATGSASANRGGKP